MSSPITTAGRDLARSVLARVAEQNSYANRALSAALDRASGLSAEDRGLATELVYGVLRRQSRLDRALEAVSDRGLDAIDLRVRIALRVGAYQILFLDRIPAYAAVSEAVQACKQIKGGRLAGLANALLRRVAERGEPPLPSPAIDPLAYIVEAAGLPLWLAQLITDELPEEGPAFADASTAPAPLAIRTNTLRITAVELRARLLVERPDAVIETSPLAPDALLLRRLDAPFVTEAWRAGLFAVEDLGAQHVTALAGAAPGERILDACAGVGGKSAHLAALAGNQAIIDAADIAPSKLSEARQMFDRLGVQGVTTRAVDLLRPWVGAGAVYDRVLLDAPCSGLGVLRRHPEALARRAPTDLEVLATQQGRMLDTVAPLVRGGGTLTYSVCTFERTECDDVVAQFLDRHPRFQPDHPPVRTWPHRDDADAFFAVRLRATG